MNSCTNSCANSRTNLWTNFSRTSWTNLSTKFVRIRMNSYEFFARKIGYVTNGLDCNYPALKENSDNYQFQAYLEKIKIVEHLTRLRTGCTYLAINTGRYEKTPKNDRKCPLCQQGIEDSSHFLFQCLKKTNIRARLQDTSNGCKTHSFKYGYLDVRQWIIMNVDFKT